ncbi:hypothetical protein [Actinosynnema sp. NPDC020468]|uniref:hypothetical protein n=1 Tax=Actinosynnema sp. NPDC020468 TaxID=3154488 RepID=UPI0033E5485F
MLGHRQSHARARDLGPGGQLAEQHAPAGGVLSRCRQCDLGPGEGDGALGGGPALGLVGVEHIGGEHVRGVADEGHPAVPEAPSTLATPARRSAGVIGASVAG